MSAAQALGAICGVIVIFAGAVTAREINLNRIKRNARMQRNARLYERVFQRGHRCGFELEQTGVHVHRRAGDLAPGRN